MLDQKRVGEFIAKLRKDRGLTQSALADMLCVTHQAVSKWENGAAMPDLEVLMEMRRVFGVSIDEILDGSSEPAQAAAQPVGTPGEADSAAEDDVVTDDRIVIFKSREFRSPVTVESCDVYGDARFTADFMADVARVFGHCKFEGTLIADSLDIAGAVDANRGVTADSLNVAGSLASGGGILCDSLNLSGRATLGGGLTCDSLSVSGILRAGGGVACDSLENAGSMAAGGGVSADSFFNSGEITIGGGLQGDSMENIGAIRAGGGLSADEFESRGELTIGGGLSAESVDLAGRFHIGGAVVANEVKILLSDDRCECRSIKCESLVVRTDRSPGAVLWTREIAADLVEIVNVHSDKVKAQRGKIGDGCKIGRLEAGPEVEVLPGAEIGDSVRL